MHPNHLYGQGWSYTCVRATSTPTFSGLLLAVAIYTRAHDSNALKHYLHTITFVIGRADVLEAKTQSSEITYNGSISITYVV